MRELNIQAINFNTVICVMECVGIKADKFQYKRLMQALTVGNMEDLLYAMKGVENKNMTFLLEARHSILIMVKEAVIRIEPHRDYTHGIAFIIYVWFNGASNRLALHLLTEVLYTAPSTYVAAFDTPRDDDANTMEWLMPVHELLAQVASRVTNNHVSRPQLKPRCVRRQWWW